MAVTDLDLGRYKLGWSDAEDYVFKPKRGLDTDMLHEMSWMKGEPDWMLTNRLKSFEHFALIASALNHKGLWDEDDGLYYDVLHLADGSSFPLRAHSLVSLIPLFAVTTFGPNTMERLPEFTRRTEWFHPQPRRSRGRGPAYPRPEPFRLADAVDRQP